MIKRKTKFYCDKITPVEFCGQPIMLKLEGTGALELPFEIEPTLGKHDFNNCQNCKTNIGEITKSLTERFQGNPKRKGFPFCCAGHSNLPTIREFDRKDFLKAPEMVSKKVIYTNQHFINSHELENWYKISTDYFEFMVQSFGGMPRNCGEALYLSDFFFYVTDMLKRSKEIPANRKNPILKFINSLRHSSNKSQTDLEVLLGVYERWYKIFPFDLNSYFGSLKDYFGKSLLILSAAPEINMYSGMTKIHLHTKNSLIDVLVDLTNHLLTLINGVSLYEKGIITDGNKIQLELIISSRKMKLKQGYKKAFPDEDRRFRRILQEWFDDEKKFFDELSPLLKGNSEKIKPRKVIEVKAPIIALFCYLLNESSALIRNPDETAVSYCKRVCTKYKLKFSDRVRQGYSNSRNNTNIQKVKELIFPKIDQETRDLITKYLDDKQPPKEKMYA